MLARSTTFSLDVLDAVAVRVEADVRPGLPGLTIVGLGDAAVREARERVQSAIANCGLKLPQRRMVVHLAPAWLRKRGSAFDLPIACSLLAASGQLEPELLDDTGLAGELSLAGEVRAVDGALAFALAARRAGLKRLMLAEADAGAAQAVSGLQIVPVRTLTQVLDILAGRCMAPDPPALPTSDEAPSPDLADVRGQADAIRALEVAAAGRHNLLLVGPPGTGKTMLARRLPGILPSLDEEAAVQVAQIRSATGCREPGRALLDDRPPFRAPHHTVSPVGLVGGGAPPRAGELTLAHLGVLFLDEFGELPRLTLEAMRQPLEDRHVTLARGGRSTVLPTDVQLVAAMNPCPCGGGGDGCRCSPADIARYRRRISGPLLDRIDLLAPVLRPEPEALSDGAPVTSSVQAAARVAAARERQQARQGTVNAALSGAQLQRASWLEERGAQLLDELYARGRLSLRGADRVLRVARTIADLRGSEAVQAVDVGAALTYRHESDDEGLVAA